ncbi:MAG: diguanylate cyclase [Blastocatellia bacterium]|nr:diguanylate cyclase [Blastocatellia bacterium]
MTLNLYNDNFGHTKGDKALQLVGQCLKATLRGLMWRRGMRRRIFYFASANDNSRSSNHCRTHPPKSGKSGIFQSASDYQHWGCGLLGGITGCAGFG